MDLWGCRIFEINPLDPGVVGVRRIAACVNNNSALSCWLCAWKCALEGEGRQWPGDSDPILRGIRRRTARLQPPRMPRKQIRRGLLRKLLQGAVAKQDAHWWWWAFIAIVCHALALRIPREFLGQFAMGKLVLDAGWWKYGPIKEKVQTGLAICTCLLRLQC